MDDGTNISSILLFVYFIKWRMKLPLKPDGQWLRTIVKKKKKVVLVHSSGPQHNDKIKEPANEMTVLPRKPSTQQGYWNEGNWQFLCSCWVFKNWNQKVKKLEWEMWKTGQGGIDGLKNQSGKWEGSGWGVDGIKNSSGKCEGSSGGINRLKNRSGKCEGSGEGGSTG
jgi:hypothetical protein